MKTRRTTLTVGLLVGGYLGWRARGARRAGGADRARRPAPSGATELGGSLLTIDKARALVNLGRVRALDVIDQALGGRSGRAA